MLLRSAEPTCCHATSYARVHTSDQTPVVPNENRVAVSVAPPLRLVAEVGKR